MASVSSSHEYLNAPAGGTVDAIRSHKSDLIRALVKSKKQVSQIAEEWSKLSIKDTTFRGHSSAEIAKAFAEYVPKYPTKSLVALVGYKEKGPVVGSVSPAGQLSTDVKLSTMDTATSTDTLKPGQAVYSWAALLRELSWAKTIYGIVWIVLGLLLLFYGYASLFWLCNASVPVKTTRSKNEEYSNHHLLLKSDSRKTSSRTLTTRFKLLRGGVGGMMLGFLFMSYLATLIHNAICVDTNRKPISPQLFFALWSLTGLFGIILGGYVAWLSRAMAGLLGAACITVVFTAMFGIKTLLVRSVLVAVFGCFFTVPLLLPRHPFIRMLVLNVCTSMIGMVTFLNGAAVAAGQTEATSNWLDLWTLLFLKKDAVAHDALTSGWATSTFKGMVAAVWLGSIVGFAFEFFLHRDSGQDPEDEWNQYLGTYTKRLELNQEGSGEQDSKIRSREPRNDLERAARAGLFEPSPSPWRRMVSFFGSHSSSPAVYGHLSGEAIKQPENGVGSASNQGSISARIRQKRSERYSELGESASRPARFQALSKATKAEELRQAKQSLVTFKDASGKREIDGSEGEEEEDDETAVEDSMNKAKPNSETHDDSEDICQSPKARDGNDKSETAEYATRFVTATPSLLGAIDRIQRAHQQKRPQ